MRSCAATWRSRGRRPHTLLAALGAVLALTGCGGSSADHGAVSAKRSASTSASQQASAQTAGERRPQLATIPVATSARQPDGRLAPQNTCAGKGDSPTVVWGAVPPKTAEVVVLARTVTRGHLEDNWVVAGISPHVHRIAAGTVPAGAIVARNSLGKVGYSMCPSPQKPAIVVFAVLALPHPLHVHQGFPASEVAPLVGSPGVEWGSVTLFAGRSTRNAVLP